jgi:hypothetical protein
MLNVNIKTSYFLFRGENHYNETPQNSIISRVMQLGGHVLPFSDL